MRDFKIGRHILGPDKPPFVIAEMSGNHNQSLDRALAIVDAAGAAGCHALKLQTYTADTMTLNSRKPAFVVAAENPLWKGETLYDLYAKAYTPWKWHKEIFARAKKHGMTAFSSPFDATAVAFLERLGAPAYKVASFENGDWPLLKRIGATRKPVIMSTGMASMAEIDESVRVLREAGCRDLVLLKCTSSYPAKPKDSHLRAIPHLAASFDCLTGLSDHTMGIGAACASVALGGRVIEKHVTLDRADGGVDSQFSSDPAELRALVAETRAAFDSLGKARLDAEGADAGNRRFRRSIFVSKDIPAGARLSADNLKVIRPAGGLEPKYLELVLGRRAKRRVTRGTPLTWDALL